MKKRWKGLLAGLLSFAMACSFSVHAQAKTNLDDFTYSYRPLIEALIAKHPNWTFEPVYTHVDWNELVEYETEVGTNLIENTVADHWKSKEQGVLYKNNTINLYDFSTNQFYILSAPNWVQPSDEAVAYYLDPRNFLNEEDIFMFENMVYVEECHTEDSINAVLGKSWMNGSFLEDDPTMTYAQALEQIGAELNVSPFMLASRLVQEQGVYGTSPLISGTYEGYEGYYNYFNIQASGQSQTEIYTNGMKEAVANGWDTRYKALLGGATEISKRYIARGQSTLYFQKFDVVDGISWHQYMQNIRAPLLEGRRVRNTYENLGLMENEFVFKIPVYDGMPDEPCKVTDPNATETPTPSETSAPTTGPDDTDTPTASPDVTVTPTPTPTPTPEPKIYGDVDLNGTVEATDALLTLQAVVKLKNLNISQMVQADVDGSDYVEAQDALYILQYVVHLVDKFPVQG